MWNLFISLFLLQGASLDASTEAPTEAPIVAPVDRAIWEDLAERDPWIATLDPDASIQVGDPNPRFGPLTRDTEGTDQAGMPPGTTRSGVMSTLAGVNASEPDNLIGQSNWGSPSAQLFGVMEEAGDLDFYGFEIPSQGSLEVRLISASPGSTIQFLPTYGTGSSIGNWRELGTEVQYVDFAAAGRYHIKIADKAKLPGATYTVEFRYLQGDMYEPNGDLGSATSLGEGRKATGNILPLGDHDVYVVTLKERGSIEAQVKNLAPGQPMSLLLQHADGASIGNWQTPTVADGSTELVTWDLNSAGDYLVVVAAAGGKWRSAVPYRLMVKTLPGDVYEPNDAFGQSTWMDLPELGESPSVRWSDRTWDRPNHARAQAQAKARKHSLQGTILPKGDHDGYRIAMDRAGAITAQVNGLVDGNQMDLLLRDGSGRSQGNWVSPATANGKSELVTWDVLHPGEYTVSLRGRGGSWRSDKPYTVTVETLPGDVHEPNGDIGSATWIAPPAARDAGPAAKSSSGQAVLDSRTLEIDGTILPKGDADHYRVFLPRRGTITARVTGLESKQVASLILRDASGTSLGNWLSPTVSNGASELVTWNVGTPGEYVVILAAKSSGWRSSKPYRLHVETLPGDVHEPNESIGLATSIEAKSTVDLSLTPAGDSDAFRLTTAGPGVLTVHASGLPKDVQPQLIVRGSSGRSLGVWRTCDIRDSATDPQIWDLPSAGTWFVVLGEKGGDARDPSLFQLHFDFEQADAHEPNPDLGSAIRLVGGAGVQATILPAGDHDHFYVDVAGEGTLEVVLTQVSSGFRPTFLVRGPSGRSIGNWQKPTVTNGKAEPFEVATKDPGRYYIEVADQDGAARISEPYQLTVHLR